MCSRHSLIDGVEPAPERRGAGVALLERRPPLPADGPEARAGGRRRIDADDAAGAMIAGDDERHQQRPKHEQRQQRWRPAVQQLFHGWAGSGGGLDGVVGVGEGLFGGVEDGLHLVQLLPDAPQRRGLCRAWPSR